MKRTRDRGREHAGSDARGRERTSRRLRRRIAIIGTAFALLTLGTPFIAATADPRPSLQELADQAEKLHDEIGTLTEQYNGGRVKLKQAQRAAESAKKTLATSESELKIKRDKAALLAQSSYMAGELTSGLAFSQSADPDSFLDQATTAYALQQQQSEEVAQLSRAIEDARQAQATAKARTEEVQELLSDIGKKRSKIERLVARVESDLFSEVRTRAASNRGARVKVEVPIPGSGKAAEAARWALTQQLKPYIWGAEGPNGFDCSGLVMWAYQKVGISLPHYTGDQWAAGTHISKDQLRPGDLVFFYSDLHHVGIYLGGGLMVHAPRTGDVIHIASIENRPFAGGVRIAD
ncbi:cell wall-associated NlpC family hydrolase [Streptosporangium becharense]|uniref:Cell wall-associated NlpC family hydrolase n=1 Tax=Streptosporangium becharense TaxID=1816182 RepID=A0A7W9IH56_9ACTN|nr:NlpC/P60 family protein [Streptosporangium becharense]MBB2912547.1 cell wall-associated NlpC family hydrolase [Streptosporangium becharense]MBB5820623.1 cell wall-associated NlpC family hydrolase [Streptosporangium becharense]